jgi:arylsulfatase A-like enzyme
MMEKALLSRRDIMQAGAAGALALQGSSAWAASRRRQPNIIFILADDMGYADVSCYGRPDYSTPHIDSIAAGGLRFLQAYANSAVCSATRTALATGRYQYRLRVGLEEPIVTPNIGLPPEHPTLASLLRKAGYGTTLIGKWHLGALPNYGPLKSGYDHFYGFRGGALDYFSHHSPIEQDDFWDDDRPIHESGYLTDLLGQRAVKVVEDYADHGKPFFVSLHFNAPHWPWEGPNDKAESQRVAGTGLRDLDGGSQKTYGEMVMAMDAQVGRILAALDRKGIRQDTIVVFTSDNGGERFADTWPFSGQKTELLEGGLRIPAVVSWPGAIPAGVTSNQVMITMDWVPTLLAAAGTQPDPQFPSDGIDLAPYLHGAAPIPRKLFWRYKADRQRALRDGDFKYLKILENTFLFNVVDDPLERANLKNRYPDVYARLAKEWREWNATMLPELDETFTEALSGAEQADHIGAKKSDRKADPGD